MEKTKELEIAAAHGAGIPLAKIAELVEEDEKTVALTIEQKVTKRDSGLDDIYLAYRLSMAPRVQRLLKTTLKEIGKRIEGAKLADLVKLYKEIAPATGLIADAVESSSTARTQQVRVDFSNPAVIRAMRERLTVERQLQDPEKTGPLLPTVSLSGE